MPIGKTGEVVLMPIDGEGDGEDDGKGDVGREVEGGAARVGDVWKSGGD